MLPHLGDVEVILLVIAGFYLHECVYSLREGVIAFVSPDGRRFRLFRAAPYLASDKGGFLLTGLFPWSQTYLCSSLPVSIDRQGVYSYAADALSPRGRGRPECRYVAFAEGPKFVPVHKEVHCEGLRFASAISPHHARVLADQLNQIAETPEAERDEAIRRWLAALTDSDEVQKRVQRFRQASMPLRWFAGALLIYTFLVAPALAWTVATRPEAWQILGVYLSFYVLLWVFTVAGFVVAHRAVAPERKSERRKHALLMLVSPATAMRAATYLSSDLLVEFHPLVVARVLFHLPADPAGEYHASVWRTFARQVLRDVRNPLLPICPSTDPRATEVTQSFRAELQSALDKAAALAGLSTEALLEPPAPEGPDARSFCPRCEQQYRIPAGACSDCGGICLVGFAEEVRNSTTVT